MAKEPSKPSVRAKKARSKPTKAEPAKASRPSAVEKFRDIDRSSVASLIQAKILSEPDGIEAGALKEHLMSRFGMAVDANLKKLRGDSTIKAAGGLSQGGPRRLWRPELSG
jgi:hypothetical protein